ncbi:hypothetical protein LOC67_11700 [Stieleria sp. JC731]|uniref:hypothetical protein n=1 Tax=Pirellulaceae TaxID=2691357 RepID=UPI001E4559F5|nr:hypothetical protein [Stieleria sp. JC731]MCC9601211.1 hypothetical protein [Stieleria sp. JC731]
MDMLFTGCSDTSTLPGHPVTLLRLAMLVLLSMLTFAAQSLAGDSTTNSNSKPGAQAQSNPLKFTSSPELTTREGYVTLTWSAVPDATRYEVFDDDGLVMYSGVFPQAFISGLPDGVYRYHVRAFSADGTELARSVDATDVTVSHWPYYMVWLLFAVGFIVTVAVVTVIVVGERWSENDEPSNRMKVTT